jgi:hypothetical protein
VAAPDPVMDGDQGLRPGDLVVRGLGYHAVSFGKADRHNIHWAAMHLPVSLLVHDRPPSHPHPLGRGRASLPDFDRRRARLAATGTTLWLS